MRTLIMGSISSLVIVIALVFEIRSQTKGHAVTIVASNDYKVFRIAAEGFWEYLEQNGYVDDDLEDNFIVISDDNAREIIDDLRKRKQDLIFTLGNSATKLIREQISGIPIIFAMVFEPVKFGIVNDYGQPGDYFSGITADISVKRIINSAVQITGRMGRIGTIYSKDNLDYVERLKRECNQENISLNAQLIRGVEDIVRVARSLQAIDLFWMIPDPVVYSSSSRQILFEWLHNQDVLIITPSQKFLTGIHGGDLAVAIDAASCGRQGAEIAVEFLNKESISIPIQEPKVLKIFVKKGLNTQAKEGIFYVE